MVPCNPVVDLLVPNRPTMAQGKAKPAKTPPPIFLVYFQENQYIMNHRYVEVPTITFLSDFL